MVLGVMHLILPQHNPARPQRQQLTPDRAG
jgi:hypothetical protein